MVHEIKFLVPIQTAPALLAWAREHMDGDPHGNGEFQDEYLVQSIYLDTPQWHVFRKLGSYGRAKYRVRRYGDENWLFLERKMKRGGIVRKRRTTIQMQELPSFGQIANGRWYEKRLTLRGLAPMCYIQYERVARQKMTTDGLLRLTVDRGLRFQTGVEWTWPGTGGSAFLTDSAILELKYLQLPALAKKLIGDFNLNPGPASKYRMALRASPYASQLHALDPAIAVQTHDDAEGQALRCA